MAYVCSDPSSYLADPHPVGTGQCVALVEAACHTGDTSRWKQGKTVKGDVTLVAGTAIATFQDGKCQNRKNGDSHAAIYMRQDSKAIYVIDQWSGLRRHTPADLVHARETSYPQQRWRRV